MATKCKHCGSEKLEVGSPAITLIDAVNYKCKKCGKTTIVVTHLMSPSELKTFREKSDMFTRAWWNK